MSYAVDTELLAYFAECKNHMYTKHIALKFWITNANK